MSLSEAGPSFAYNNPSGFNTEERKELSKLKIVPIHTSSAGENAIDPVECVQIRQCFFEPPGESTSHHKELFNFVRFSSVAHSFLEMCGAKPRPDYVDIVEALIRDAPSYLQIAESSK